MSLIPGKGYALHELKNLMISTEGRPRADICGSASRPRSLASVNLLIFVWQFTKFARTSRLQDSTGQPSTPSTRTS